MVDHIKGETDDHSLVAFTNLVDVAAVSGDSKSRKPVLYQGSRSLTLHVTFFTIILTVPGLSQKINAQSGLNFAVLRGFDSTYSAAPAGAVSADSTNIGRDTVLVSALQARNNARVLVSGKFFLAQTRSA